MDLLETIINRENEKAAYYESLIENLDDETLKEEIMKVWPKIKNTLFEKPETLTEFVNAQPDDMWQYHFGLGMYLRDKYLKPDGELYKLFVKNGITEPVDMSSVMVVLFQQNLLENA